MAIEPGRVDLKVGDRVRLGVSYSKVCVSMGVAGQALEVEVLKNGVQLYKDGRPFSSPIAWGEAGLYTDQNTHKPYTYNAKRITG